MLGKKCVCWGSAYRPQLGTGLLMPVAVSVQKGYRFSFKKGTDLKECLCVCFLLANFQKLSVL